jgi:hypothetical protein
MKFKIPKNSVSLFGSLDGETSDKEDEDEEVPVEASGTSSSVSKTVAQTTNLDCTDDEAEVDDVDLDKFESLSIATVKNKAEVFEKLANELPSCSKENQDTIKKKLSGKKKTNIMCIMW